MNSVWNWCFMIPHCSKKKFLILGCIKYEQEPYKIIVEELALVMSLCSLVPPFILDL